MKVKFYIPLERAIDVLHDLECEYYENVGPNDIYIEPPFLVDCIEVFLNSKVARNFIPKPITPSDELPF